MPSLADDTPGLPDRVVEIVARSLAKRKANRYRSAAELLLFLHSGMMVSKTSAGNATVKAGRSA